MEKNERIQEIERQIALLKAEKAQLNGSTDSFVDLREYFAVEMGITGVTIGGTHGLYGRQREAWDHLRKLAICAVCKNHNTKIKDLSMEDWKRSREVLKELIDFYVKMAEKVELE